jgi:hypothetical protein
MATQQIPQIPHRALIEVQARPPVVGHFEPLNFLLSLDLGAALLLSLCLNVVLFLKSRKVSRPPPLPKIVPRRIQWTMPHGRN